MVHSVCRCVGVVLAEENIMAAEHAGVFLAVHVVIAECD
jgi:hypothetical protein